MLAQAFQPQYVCPGETRPISRAVHLSRLATYYVGCRECPLRFDHGAATTVAEGSRSGAELADGVEDSSTPRGAATSPKPRRTIFEADGVRGVWRNELTRGRAGELAMAFAAALWESSPVGKASGRDVGGLPTAPSVVIAHDERPSAPDIVTGVAASLRLMGCQVIDLGVATAPCVWHAVDHLDVAGGLLVTGAGRPPSWTGLDFIGRGALPVSDLAEIERRAGQPISRPTRAAPAQRSFQGQVPYEAGLLKHFHALRPLRVCCGTSSRLVRDLLERLFARLPCALELVETPQRARDVAHAEDEDVRRIGAAVTASRADLGVLIDDDARRCGFVDERGEAVAPESLLRLLFKLSLAEHPRGAIVISDDVSDRLREFVERCGGRVAVAGASLQRFSVAMSESLATCGGDLEGRVWFRERFPTCDATITLAKVMDALSRDDRSFSDAVRDSDSRTSVS